MSEPFDNLDTMMAHLLDIVTQWRAAQAQEHRERIRAQLLAGILAGELSRGGPMLDYRPLLRRMEDLVFEPSQPKKAP
jgi:DNA invertase Pin-like site-specific DNA recombinase